jgi:hypothetical protein
MDSVEYIIKEDGIIKFKEFEVIEGDTTGPTPEMFLTRDEIVYDIVNNRLSEDDSIYFKNLNEDDMAIERMGFGMWIRNSYGLWQCESNPLTEIDAGADSITHPDNLSGEIMDLVKQTLMGNYTPDVSLIAEKFNDAMKLLGE